MKKNNNFIFDQQEQNLYFKIPKKTFEKIHCIEKIHHIIMYYNRERRHVPTNGMTT